ncbi:MAG: hypothetical protein AAFN77_19045 [Planctomycetota bacterium]
MNSNLFAIIGGVVGFSLMMFLNIYTQGVVPGGAIGGAIGGGVGSALGMGIGAAFFGKAGQNGSKPGDKS